MLLQLGGEALDIEWMKKGKGRASVGRAFIDVYGAIKALENIYGFLTDDEEHGLAEYSRAARTVSRTLAIGTGWMGNAFGYWSTVVAIATNPIDFGLAKYEALLRGGVKRRTPAGEAASVQKINRCD